MPAAPDDITADLLANAELSGTKTFCAVIGVRKKTGYVPGFGVNARFGEPVSGFLEVNGKRVKSWKSSAEVSYRQNYIEDGQRFRITIGVTSHSHVNYLQLGGSSDFGIVEIRETECTKPQETK
jgi:hypothetical protein